MAIPVRCDAPGPRSKQRSGMRTGVNEARDVVRSQLGLAEPVDSVGALHRAVATSDTIIRAPDGNPCIGLLGRFTVDDTPFLRGIVN